MEAVSKTKTDEGIWTVWIKDDKYLLVPPPPLNNPRQNPGGTWGMANELASYLKGRLRGDGVCRPASCFSGEFHPRIWRGAESPPAEDVGFGRAWIDSAMVARDMSENLREVFASIYPEPAHFGVYGNRLRELLILACTEVESSWRSVLRENTVGTLSDRLTTNDYVKLLLPMRLDGWEVELVHFLQLGQFNPFSSWNAGRPTASIPWYDAYNAIKHDREGSMNQATLKNVLNSISAVHIMVAAQFGPSHLTGEVLGRDEFRITRIPEWQLDEYYTRPISDPWEGSKFLGHDKWTPKPLGL
jgi:hypothetical protein